MANKVAQEAFNHLIGDLRATHGDNLASVVLYGSAASGDFVQIESDYNLLIALYRITPEDLRLAQAPMREWPPVLKREVVRAAVRLLGLDGVAFERVFELREAGGDAPLDEREADELFADYMAQVERVIEAVDALEVTGRGRSSVV